MEALIEGAENYADVSPTDSPSETGGFEDDFDAQFDGDDNHSEGSPEVGNQGAGDGRERFIPRERFDRIHEELYKRKAWDPVIDHVRQAYASPEAYVEAARRAESDPKESVRAEEGLTDEDRLMLHGSRQAVLEAQRNNQFLQGQLRELAIANAKSELKAYLPTGMPRGVENMLRSFPLDLIPEATRDIRSAIEQAVRASQANAPDPDRIITEYNSRKEADRAIPAPETRGGNPPRTLMGGSDAWKQPLSRLLGWTGTKG